MTIFVDGSIMTGYDAYKALALGADGVLIGRAILKGLLDQGSEAVEEKVLKMNEELAELMMYTGIKNTATFDPNVLHFN